MQFGRMHDFRNPGSMPIPAVDPAKGTPYMELFAKEIMPALL